MQPAADAAGPAGSLDGKSHMVAAKRRTCRFTVRSATRPVFCFVFLLAPLLTPVRALSANFNVVAQPGERLTFIEMSGPIAAGDDERFRVIANRAPFLFTIVVLDSPGGSVGPALTIGREIKARGFSTIVKSGATCASACALVWLAGDSRYMARGAKIGFHAASIVEGDTPIERGMPNAVIGAYLNTLELPETAIVYITKASPRQMEWFTVLNGIHYGINFKVPGESGE
jgi:hypothetical protein